MTAEKITNICKQFNGWSKQVALLQAVLDHLEIRNKYSLYKYKVNTHNHRIDANTAASAVSLATKI